MVGTIVLIALVVVAVLAASDHRVLAKVLNANGVDYQQLNESRWRADRDFTSGQTARFDDLSVRVVSSTVYTPSDNYSLPSDGKQFIAVQVEITNRAQQSVTISPYLFTALQDGTETSAHYLSEDGFSRQSLGAGRSINATLVFELAPQFQRRSLLYHTTAFDPVSYQEKQLRYQLAF